MRTPRELSISFLEPLRRALLDLLKQLTHGNGAWQRASDVYMVRHPANAEGMTAMRIAC
jgi:hypothetical protein